MKTPASSSIRKNDNVLVIAGRDRGKKGRVLRVIRGKGRLVVEGVSVIKKHTRLVCPECGAPTRIGKQQLEDGRRVRICRKCNGVVDK